MTSQIPQKRIFLTGASGYVGSVITELAIKDGYQIHGLSRHEESDSKLRNLGAVSQHTHFLAPPCFWHPQKRENPPQPNAHPQPPFITTFSIRVQMGSSFAHVFFYI
ncbi:hypothetical protein CTAM01_08873 [Colletotrichum tamarilloi]|uniref:NAD-dependent epimerase/dehydratase domain-containing protein n=1 Tax=Colletotrichum tamarilloi TaxID=1209934 RepID=A0ABQ9R4I0_9PEZI|nr:uncharacterized protein CTAM01_08873 [Colletotrichum tamarilloi]KAK1494519.1 hypothetical protein CTAM01_08873 [Colletotrichum tamarilloi]